MMTTIHPYTEKAQSFMIFIYSIVCIMTSTFWLIFWFTNRERMELGNFAVAIQLITVITLCLLAYTQFSRFRRVRR